MENRFLNAISAPLGYILNARDASLAERGNVRTHSIMQKMLIFIVRIIRRSKLPHFYAPRAGEQKLNAQKFMEEWEKEKKATHCPSPHEARRFLGLSLKQFAELLELSERKISRLTAGLDEFSFAQKLLINMAIELYKKNKEEEK